MSESLMSQVPYIEQYAGVWAIEESAFQLLADRAKSLDLAVHLQTTANAVRMSVGSASDLFEITPEGVAILSVRGVMMKHASSLTGGTSTVLARRALSQLIGNDEVKAVLMRIESPGGTAAGTAEFAADIARANAIKPVVAFVEDLGASAAYWVASAASKVYANAMAKVGSIGTYSVVQDVSAAAAQQGVKVHVVRAGSMKGAGVPGTEVTSDMLAEIQRLTNATNEFFVRGVAEGRGMTTDQVREIADGRVHMAADAKRMGLIDGVLSFEETLARMSVGQSKQRNRRMSSAEPQAAQVREIKAACPDITSDKVLEYAESGKTLEQCKDAWMQELATENAALREEVGAQNEELLARIQASSKRIDELEEMRKREATLGVDPVSHKPSEETNTEGSATEEFQALIEKKVAGGLSRAKATASVVRSHPDLHKQMIAEANAR